MADGVVKIVLRSIAEGSGFAETVRDVNKAMGGVGDLSKALQTMGKIAGTTGGLFGSMLGNLVKGGFWGVAAEGVRLVVGKIEEWRESARKAREEQVRLVKESTKSLIAGIEKVSAARAGLAAAEGAWQLLRGFGTSLPANADAVRRFVGLLPDGQARHSIGRRQA